MNRGGAHPYGMQQGFQMTKGGHPNMAGLGVGPMNLSNRGGHNSAPNQVHMLMNLAEAVPVEKTHKKEHSHRDKTLDELVLDYGMENEYTMIDMERPTPFNGLGEYGSWNGYEYGEPDFGENGWNEGFYGAFAPMEVPEFNFVY